MRSDFIAKNLRCWSQHGLFLQYIPKHSHICVCFQVHIFVIWFHFIDQRYKQKKNKKFQTKQNPNKSDCAMVVSDFSENLRINPNSNVPMNNIFRTVGGTGC